MLLLLVGKILKLSMETGMLQESAWALMLEWGEKSSSSEAHTSVLCNSGVKSTHS